MQIQNIQLRSDFQKLYFWKWADSAQNKGFKSFSYWQRTDSPSCCDFFFFLPLCLWNVTCSRAGYVGSTHYHQNTPAVLLCSPEVILTQACCWGCSVPTGGALMLTDCSFVWVCVCWKCGSHCERWRFLCVCSCKPHRGPFSRVQVVFQVEAIV